MAEQEFDLYGDLEEFELKQVVKEKNDAHKKLEDKYELAIKTINNLHNDVKEWKKKCHNIEKSFWSLLETSKAEIKRKDTQLDALRRQRDDIAFRRVKNNNIETRKNVFGEGNASGHFNPFRSENKRLTNENYDKEVPSSNQTEQTENSRNKDLKKSVHDNSKRNNNLNYKNEHNETRGHNNNDSPRSLNHNTSNKRNNKDESNSKRSDKDVEKCVNYHNAVHSIETNENYNKKQCKDSGKVKNYRSLDSTCSKDDSKCKNKKEDYPTEINKLKKSDHIENKERKQQTDTDNNKSDTKRICKLTEKIAGINSKESIKLTVTIPNSITNDKTQTNSPTPTSKIDLTIDTSDKKQIAKTIPKSQTITKNCEEYAATNNLISELMKDLKQLNNNTITPVETTNKINTKSFQDILFDSMVCGDEALSVQNNFDSKGTEINNFNKTTSGKKENKKEICDNLQKLSEESNPLIHQEIQLENSFTTDLNITLKDTPVVIAKDITEIVDENLNTNYSERDIFEDSFNDLIPRKSQLDDENIEKVTNNISQTSSDSVNVFGTDITTPIKISPQNLTKIITESHVETNLIPQNTFNTSATKFYELYLESPVKLIRDINEKRTKEVTDSNQIVLTEGKQINISTVNEGENEIIVKKQSNEKLIKNGIEIDAETNIKEMLENRVLVNLKNENTSDIRPQIIENIILVPQPNNQFKINVQGKEASDELIQTNNTEISKEIDVIENTKKLSDAANDKSDILDFNQNSDSIITPITMSPNQQETIEATKYLTDILETNTQSQSSPLKMRMKLLFGETPESHYKIISTPTHTGSKAKNKYETSSNNNEIVKHNFCNKIVKDNNTKLNEFPTSVNNETEIVSHNNEKNTNERKNKRKAEISPKPESSKVSNWKRCKVDSSSIEKELKILSRSHSENDKYEINPKLHDKKSSVRNNKRPHSNSNKDPNRNSNLEQEFHNIGQSSKSEGVIKKLKDSYTVTDEKSSLKQSSDYNFVNENNLQKSNGNVDKKSQLDPCTNKEHIDRICDSKTNDEPIILTLNITRKKRKNANKNSKCSRNVNISAQQHENLKPELALPTTEEIVTNNSNLINFNKDCDLKIPKLPQTSIKTISPQQNTNSKPEGIITNNLMNCDLICDQKNPKLTQNYTKAISSHENSKPEEIISNHSKLISCNLNYEQKISKQPQVSDKTIKERNECIKNYKIPKLNKSPHKKNIVQAKQENFLKHFKIPKTNKKSEIVQEILEENNVMSDSITEDTKENSESENRIVKDEIKLLNNKNCNNSTDLTSKSTPEKTNKTTDLNKKYENENTSTPKQHNNLAMPNALSKIDEELFDCIFKSPLQVSCGNNSSQLGCERENSGGNSEYLPFNQIEEDFRKLFGKSPRSTSPSLPICSTNQNNSIQNYKKSETDNLSASQADLSVIIKLHTENDNNESDNITAKTSSTINESSILCKNFSTSSKEYQMVYDTKEGITNWIITRKKIKKKKKSIT